MRDGSEKLPDVDQIPEKRGAGRPRVQITKEKQRLIQAALRGGLSPEEVGTTLGYSRNTIEKYFFRSAPTDQDLRRAAERLRRMGSELKRFSEDLLDRVNQQANSSGSEGGFGE